MKFFSRKNSFLEYLEASFIFVFFNGRILLDFYEKARFHPHSSVNPPLNFYVYPH